MLPKLVRDRIPELIRKDGKIPIFHAERGEDLLKRVFQKLVEEAQECVEAKDPQEQLKELADLHEVLERAIELHLAHTGKSRYDFLLMLLGRQRNRGGFDEGFVLDEIRDGSVKNE